MDDASRRWTRELLALKTKAAKAVKGADARVADVLRETLAACDGLLHDLQATAGERSRLSDQIAAAGAEWVSLFDRLPCPCVCTDSQGFILKANAAAASLLAITSRHLDARLLTHFTEDREQFSRVLRAVGDRVEVRERMSIRPRDRAPVTVDAVVMTKSPSDMGTLLWFLQPEGNRADRFRGDRRTGAPRSAASGLVDA